MTVWKVDLIPEAKADFAKLDGHVRKQVLKQLSNWKKTHDMESLSMTKQGLI